MFEFLKNPFVDISSQGIEPNSILMINVTKKSFHCIKVDNNTSIKKYILFKSRISIQIYLLW